MLQRRHGYCINLLWELAAAFLMILHETTVVLQIRVGEIHKLKMIMESYHQYPNIQRQKNKLKNIQNLQCS